MQLTLLICRYILSLVLLFSINTVQAQKLNKIADSLHRACLIPGLAYAVVTADSILEYDVIGIKNTDDSILANINDRFRLGSNTKAITGFIAAQLIAENKLTWDTPFFDLFPELRKKSNRNYRNLTLLDLLSFRTNLFPYTYTNASPTETQFTGNAEEQRYAFAQWFLQQPPVKSKSEVHFSNVGYTLAGLMLEKASGKSYRELVTALGLQLDIDFGFGAPNSSNILDTWGHYKNGNPEPPAANIKLEWLLAAGNINCSITDYAKFIQLHLSGLQGKSDLLPQATFKFLHYGLPRFAVGWFWEMDNNNEQYSYNFGNPGTYLSHVYVFADSDKAFIVFANIQSEAAERGLNELYLQFKKYYLQQ